ncbi:F-actin-uncapping protein LRRC16A [Bulinus truncatus]|nr:F-actin-uncapping protein LRRC16A [Bulinus truncatus]
MEIRSDRSENRILAFSAFRLYILTAKVPSRLENSFHFLEIESIESKKSNQLTLIVDGKVIQFFSDNSSGDIDQIITHIGISLKNVFTSYPLERLFLKVDLQPVERLKTLTDNIRTMHKKDSGSCGGFTEMYQCMCDYHSQPLRDEVVWDIDTIYLSHDCRELRLQDFDHLSGKDLVPIIGALEHNTWFKQLNASNVKLSLEACNELIKVMKRNSVLEEINLSNTGIKIEFIQKFSLAITSNSSSQLNSLDISSNPLEDKALYHLMGALKHLSSGLSYFDISKTGISTKCLNKVGEMLAQSKNITVCLNTLKVNDNGQRGDDLLGLYNFLAQPSVISYLDLSSTDCTLDTLCEPLLRGCQNLTVLKASKTVFTHKKTKEVVIPNSWKQFFATACSLEYVDFSSCRLPSEALKELLIGISCNKSVKEMFLDVSSNELGGQGAAAISSCISQVKGIKTLDISNNGFDTEMKTVLLEVAKNPYLKSLCIGRNFFNIRPKNMPEVMNTIVQMLQEETCHLESFSIADSRLKADTTYIINVLGSNNSLLEIDLSGNIMGDFGARMLAKALLINTKLHKVLWDRNNVTATGFEDVAEALKKNMTLKQMPIPISDVAAALGMSLKKTEIALQKIESYLLRNNSPRRFASDQVYRLQQGFLISSSQQMIDRLVVQVQDTVNILKSCGTLEVYATEVKEAELLIEDANKSKLLLPGLHDISLKSQASENPISTQLKIMSSQVTDVFKESLQKTVEEMLNCAKNYCPVILTNQTFQKFIQDGCQSKLLSLPKDFSRDVLEGASVDIFNLASEINLSVAALISDSVVGEIIDSLTVTQKNLSNHLCLRKSGQYIDKTEKQVEDLQNKKENNIMVGESSVDSANRRRTILQRKNRPQSTIGAEFVATSNGMISESSGLAKIEENNAGITKGVSVDSNDFGDLSVSFQPLEHVTKARPKRGKVHRPTRPIHLQGSTELDDQPNNDPSSQNHVSYSAPVLDDKIKHQSANSDSNKKPEEPLSKNGGKKLQKKVKVDKDKDVKEVKKSSVFANMFKKKEEKKKSLSETIKTSSESGQDIVESKTLDTPSEVLLDNCVEPSTGPEQAGSAAPRAKLIVPPERVALLPPTKKVEAKSARLTVEEEYIYSEQKNDSKKDVEKKEEISKLPAGVKPTVLVGHNIIQEIKEKRFSKINTSSSNDVKIDTKPNVETNNNVREEQKSSKQTKEAPILEMQSDQQENVNKQANDIVQFRNSNSPVKRPMSSIEEHQPCENITKSMTTSTPELTFSDGLKARPAPPPKPRSKQLKRDSNPDENKDITEIKEDPSLVEAIPSEGIVYDSATLRLPVKEKIKRLSQALENKDNSNHSAHLSGAKEISLDTQLQDPKECERKSDDNDIKNLDENKILQKDTFDQHSNSSNQNKEDEIMV